MEKVENSVTKEQLLLKQHNRILGVTPQLLGFSSFLFAPKITGTAPLEMRGCKYTNPWHVFSRMYFGGVKTALDLELQEVVPPYDLEKTRMKLGHSWVVWRGRTPWIYPLEVGFLGGFSEHWPRKLENPGWFMPGLRKKWLEIIPDRNG